MCDARSSSTFSAGGSGSAEASCVWASDGGILFTAITIITIRLEAIASRVEAITTRNKKLLL